MQEITITEFLVYGITTLFCIKIVYDFIKSDIEDKAYIEEIKKTSCF